MERLDKPAAEKKITELEAKKSAMITELLGIFRILRRKGYEAKAILPYLEENNDVRAGPLRRKIDAIEFKIATEAYTPADEKEYIKLMKEVEQELDEAIKVEKVRKRKGYIETDLKKAEDRKTAIEAELAKIRAELKNLRDSIKQARETAQANERERRYHDNVRKKTNDRRHQERQELTPFMKPLNDLSLEDIVIIERKHKPSASDSSSETDAGSDSSASESDGS